ncbi:MAG TPA: N-acetyltransferase [Phycisphaerae bacterium]|nr:N-acetyltransferase [Phycisphaerae bacterium]
MITIRPEQPADAAGIRKVNELAFGRPVEADLVEALRRSAAFIPELSLAACDGDLVVGHVLFKRMTIESPGGSTPVLALAPLAILPARQRQGIGSMLVREGLDRCRRLGHSVVVVIGHGTYYPRFGFKLARPYGIDAPFPVPDEAFMVLELTPGTLKGVEGMVRYPPEFDGLS